MIRDAFPFALSAVTVWGMWLVGQKRASGWVVGLANQAMWIAFSILFAAWGLLPLSAFLIVVYSRNLWLWTRTCSEACSEAHTYGRWCKARVS